MLARNCQAAGREGGQGWPEEAGGTWTWTALDAETKLIVSWLSAGVMPNAPMPFMTDLGSLPRGDQAGTGPRIRTTNKAGVGTRQGVARPESRHGDGAP